MENTVQKYFEESEREPLDNYNRGLPYLRGDILRELKDSLHTNSGNELICKDVVIHVDKEMLKWLGMDKFPDDPQELAEEIRTAVYLAYARVRYERLV